VASAMNDVVFSRVPGYAREFEFFCFNTICNTLNYVADADYCILQNFLMNIVVFSIIPGYAREFEFFSFHTICNVLDCVADADYCILQNFLVM
jgi:hypothetical protein